MSCNRLLLQVLEVQCTFCDGLTIHVINTSVCICPVTDVKPASLHVMEEYKVGGVDLT